LGPGRLHALIDGVFAIALTLLVLDLPKPAHSTQLAWDLLHAWPSYLAYLVSFVTVGLLWIEHHGMMSAVRAINRRFLERTLAFLLFISIIPWPTALAADYATQSAPEARAAAVLYAGTMLLMGLSFAWGWGYLAAHPELVAEPARPAFPAGGRRALLGGLVYLLAIAVAFFSPAASFAIDALVAVYFAVSRSRIPELIVRSAQTGDSGLSCGHLSPHPCVRVRPHQDLIAYGMRSPAMRSSTRWRGL
jgi:TMEM175 potassium channel family protein